MSDPNLPNDPTANDPYAARPAGSDPYASGGTTAASGSTGSTAASGAPSAPSYDQGQPYGQGGYSQMPPPPPGAGGYGGPVGTPPPNYLVWAILSTLLCCMPLGVASIVFAAQVNSKWSMGDYAGAQDASAKAKKFAIWSAIAGVIVGVLYLGVMILGGGLAAMSDSVSSSVSPSVTSGLGSYVPGM